MGIVNIANLALALALIVLLALKEILSGADGRWRALNRALPWGVIPLMIAFLATVAIKVVEYMR